jgi:hypothetical protein
MRLSELFFVFLFLGTLVALAITVIMVVRQRWTSAGRLAMALAAGWAAYLGIVFAVAALTPQRVVEMNQDRCFDEMCFAVVRVETATQLGPGSRPVRAAGTFYVVTVQVSSRSRGRTQREQGLRAMLWDSGRYFSVSAQGQHAWEASHGKTANLTAQLSPGETLLSVQVFDVPADVSTPGLVLTHGFTPGYFVIGECPLFHKPTIVRLAARRTM